MLTSPQLSVAAIDRPLPLRARPDLKMERQVNRSVNAWVVHDPVALRTYQLGSYEQFLLSRLDGQISLASLKREFDRHFAPRKLDVRQLHAFLQMMHREGLVLAETNGQGIQLLARRRSLVSRQRWTRALNLLAIRFPGVNPSPMLRRLEPWTRWLFTPASLATALSLMLLAIWMVVTSAMRGDLPHWESLLTWRTSAYVFVAIGFAKVLHELGHALTCVHFGGRCHEIGLMLLVFSPCLYCDVSGSIMLSGKWPRIAVSAAGMVVELGIATVSILMWHFSQPGPLHDFCFVLAVVCSLNTLLINGNPLLRFDGYYLLADYLEIPNLQTLANQFVRGLLGQVFLKAGVAQPPRVPGVPNVVLFSYGVLAAIYRLLVVIGIVWMAYRVLSPRGAILVAHLLSALVLVNVVILPQISWCGTFADPTARRNLRWRRVIVSAIAAVTLLIGLLVVPYPQHLWLTAAVSARGAQRVYVTVPGILTECVAEGEHVVEGQPLAKLINLELDLEIAQLESQVREQRQLVEDLQRTQGSQLGSGEQLPTAESALVELQERLRQRHADRQRLILCATQGGTVLPAENSESPAESDDLDRIDGLPTDKHNLQRYLDVGTLLCLVGDPEKQQAFAWVEASDVNMLAPGQAVVLYFQQFPGQRWLGTVDQVSAIDLPTGSPLHPDSAARQAIPRQVERPASSYLYQVRIELQSTHSWLRLGTQGTARVTVRSESLGQRAWKNLRRGFALGL